MSVDLAKPKTPTPAVSQPALGESLGLRFATGAFWALFGAVISRGLTLAASVVAARLLGTSSFGEVNMIQSTQGLFGVLAGAGLGLAATKFVAEYRSVDAARARRCINLSTLLALIAGLAGGGLLCFWARELAQNVLQAPHLVQELQVASGLILFGAINGVQTGALAGLGEFRAVAHVNILRGATLFAALVIGVSMGGVMGGVIGLVVTEAVAVVVSQLALQRASPQRWSEAFADRGAWNEMAAMLRFSGLALLASLATTLAMWFSNVMLATQTDGYASLGIFNAAERWRQVLLFLPASVAPILLSMLSNLHGKNDPAGYRKLVAANLWLSIVVVAIPAAAIMLAVPMAMSLFGAEYEKGSTTLVILAASTIAVVANKILGQILISKGAMAWRFLIDVLLAVLLAWASWLLVPTWHAQGLALGHLLAYAAAAVGLVGLVVFYLKKEGKGA